MIERYFASDHHLGHGNIIKYCHRPFANVKEMDEALLTYHNQVVPPEAHVSFLGDITIRRGGRIDREWFCREMKKYNGHKRLFLGNHDHFPIQTYLDAGFEKVYATWRSEEGILWSHIPIHPRSMGSAIANCHGHTHNNTTQDGQVVEFPPVEAVWTDKKTGVQRHRVAPYVNISVEVTDYKPVCLDWVLQKVKELGGERG